MNFNSLQYALFLPFVVALFWMCPHRWRVPILLVASYAFYMSWRPIYIFLILGLTLVNYVFGLQIWKSTRHKKMLMIAGIATNLLVLAYFKYFYFLEDSYNFLAGAWHHHVDIPLQIILPLGISFFVFEFIHYLVDVYKGTEPVRDFMAFALFPSFFPTQIAGPIKRFQDFIPQLKVQSKPNITDFDQGFYLILTGLFKKVLLADNMALYVNAGFTTPDKFSGIELWLFTVAFAFQVYFDFSGYADIARGSAKLFGYNVPINFNFPYLAENVSDQWRRWHITLSSWLRDYVFIPMGGSRAGRLAIARNLIITMALGGLWHGASLHFLLWGVYHGILLALHREFKAFREKHPLLNWLDSKAGHAFSIACTFLAWCLGLAIFRANDTASMILILRKMILLDGLRDTLANPVATLLANNYPLIFPSMVLLLPICFLAQIPLSRLSVSGAFAGTPRPWKIAFGTALLFAIVAYTPDYSPRFIYFQF